MLRHTIDRVAPLFASDHLMTTVNAGHLSWAFGDLHDRLPETVVIQPFNRETGPGILLSLLHVHHADPQAIVGLFPADHFILQEEYFRSYIVRAFDKVTADPDQIILLGIAPTSLQYGYGWIETEDRSSAEEIHKVKRFWEKPNAPLTQYLYDKGCLWNTMTLIGSAGKLLRLMELHMSEIYSPILRIARSLGTTFESDVTEDVFSSLPSVNFSRALLEKAADQLHVMHVHGVYWNDWGDEHRIMSDIESLEHQEFPYSESNILYGVE